MSADLLAAFGVPQPAQSSAVPNSGKGQSLDDTDESPWILQSQRIPDVLIKSKDEPLWKTDSKGADVLFDASDAEGEGEYGDDDEFGDFEAASPQKNKQVLSEIQQPHGDNINLLGLDDFSELSVDHVQTRNLPASDQAGFDHQPRTKIYLDHGPQSNSERRHVPDNTMISPQSVNQLGPKQFERPMIVDDTDDWGDFEDVATRSDDKSPATIDRGLIPNQSQQEESSFEPDEWEAFDDGPASEPPSKMQPENWNRGSLGSTSRARPTPSLSTKTSIHPQPKPHLSAPRPTNIPPPSTLLQLLPQIYRDLSTRSRKCDSLSDLATQLLQVYITTAHIIAGRTSRWKRDTILSQSTRISQAGVKHTGMKLTALDKSESIKEEQEAQEVVAAWQRHAAALNAVMLKAKVQKPPMSLSSNMAAKVTSGPSVLTAKECCAVCGLNRNERVMGIDTKVEDSFGEFWVEHWGHRNCWDFWYSYEGLLNKR